MNTQASPTINMSKKILFFLILSSLILFIFSFSYFVFVSNDQANNSPYYRVGGMGFSDLTTVIQRDSWLKQGSSINAHLLRGETVEQSFVARSDNLGTIAIPFDAHNRSINDQIVFRLKEIGKHNWYFQSTYNANQFQTDIPFPFGFPVIKDSKNKSFIFQIESLSGKINNSISLSKTNTIFLSKYKFSKQELIRDPLKLVQFLIIKMSTRLPVFTSTEIISLIFFTLFPFVLYFLFYPYVKRFGKFIEKHSRFSILGKQIDLVLLKNTINNLKEGMNRNDKIRLCCLIISVGFFSSVTFHYFQGAYYKQVFPINSFIPNWFFGDFFGLIDQWSRLKFTGVGYGLSYFPGTYLVVNLFTTFFANPYVSVFVYLTIFIIFMFFYTYKNVKTDKILDSIQNAFIILFMSYPFLFAIQTANVEIITFMCVSLFFVFYKRNRLLSLIFLAYATSMKVFPGIFIVLLLLEKRYKDIFLTCIFTILFTLLPLLIFDGGFNQGIGNYIVHLKQSQQMYVDLMIVSGAGNHYGHSLLNGLRVAFPSLFPSMGPIMFPYQIFVVAISLLMFGYLVFFEKIFWKKIAILVMLMDLLPFTSTDYKLLYIFLPLFLFINHSKKSRSDAIFIILFSLLLIPKDYFYFNNWPMATFNVVANPIIMLIILGLIIVPGIRSNLNRTK